MSNVADYFDRSSRKNPGRFGQFRLLAAAEGKVALTSPLLEKKPLADSFLWNIPLDARVLR